MTARHSPERHHFRPETPLRRSALLRPCRACGASAGGEDVSVPPPIWGDHDRVGAAVSSGGARAGEGAPGSRATGATAAVSFGSEEAGTGTGAEAGGGTDAANLAIKSWRRGWIKSGRIAAGATAPALGLAQ